MPEPVPVQMVVRVAVTYHDGTTEEIQAAGPVQVQGPFMIVPTAHNGHVGISERHIKRWEAVTSGLALVVGAN